MTDDILLEIMKNDELVTELKKSLLDHIAIQNAIFKLHATRKDLSQKRIDYNEKVDKDIRQLDHEIYRIKNQREENPYRLIDARGSEVAEAPRFSRECIDLFIKFCDEYENEYKEDIGE